MVKTIIPQRTNKPLIIVVLGPTASGKSELAVSLAKKYRGEIISADSRQVYRGMDIGSGKVDGHYKDGIYFYKSIPHFGIDIASPQTQYSVAQFQKYASKKIIEITKRGSVPIICGGTGHWIDALVFNQQLPKIKPDKSLRKELENFSNLQLFQKLKKLDPVRASTIDAKNPRRLIRALEIVLSSGKPVPVINSDSPYEIIWIGIKAEQQSLSKKIEQRLKLRMKQGMIKEISTLHKQGLSWKKLENFGLEYKFGALFLQNKIDPTEMQQQLLTSIKQYAKRQMTWFKRNTDIHWIKNFKDASSIINQK